MNMNLRPQAKQDSEESYSAQRYHRKNRSAAGETNPEWRDCPTSLAHMKMPRIAYPIKVRLGCQGLTRAIAISLIAISQRNFAHAGPRSCSQLLLAALSLGNRFGTLPSSSLYYRGEVFVFIAAHSPPFLLLDLAIAAVLKSCGLDARNEDYFTQGQESDKPTSPLKQFTR
jgi:hypothetical protein